MKLLKFKLVLLVVFAVNQSFGSSVTNHLTEINMVGDITQDTLYLKDGRVLPITFISETPMKVKFKKTIDGSGRSWTKDKVTIIKIVMADGTVKSYSSLENSSDSNDQVKSAATFGAAAIVVVIIGVLALLTGLFILLDSL